MCFFLYLASDEKHDLIEWDESDAQLCVEDVSEGQIKPKVFSKTNVYRIGSDQGCGCGFRQESDALYPEFAEIESNRKNQQALFEYLTESLKYEESIELFGVWAGDEEEPVKKKREVMVSEIGMNEFFFVEGELTTVNR